MKEMLGGCCICADENGWTGNPLVYCDGEKCDVAVHQGCYGIVQVPDGPWLCARCSAAPASLNAQCSLCPNPNGALKRADNGEWAHVICALYIPEVTFGDVNSMDPVITSHIPELRYNQTCYLCEQRNQPLAAAKGACMQCNKPACKKYFHVTCAQAEGLLCEEGGTTQNVRYCGYCTAHAKKMANDPTVKVVPAYRAMRPSTSSGQSTPDLKAPLMPTASSNGRPPSALLQSSTTAGSQQQQQQVAYNLMDALSALKQAEATTNHHSVSGGMPASFSVPPSAAAAFHHSSLNGPIGTLAEVASLSSASTSVTASGVAANGPLLGLGSSSSSLDTTGNVGAGLPPAPPKTGKRGRPPGSTTRHSSTSVDGGGGGGVPGMPGGGGPDDRPNKRPRKSHTKRTVKTLLELVDPVVQDTVSDFQRERVAAQQSSSSGTTQQLSPAQQQSTAFTMPLQPPATSGQQQQQQPGPSDTSSSALAALTLHTGGSEAGPSAYHSHNSVGIPLKPTPKLGLLSPDAATAVLAGGPAGSGQPAGSAGSTSSGAAYPTSLEQLLERQWEQGSQFLMDQAQHFDIASLLSCLNQLKVENQRLEESIVSLVGRRDHLLAVNARLSLALGSQQTQTGQSPLASPQQQQQPSTTQAADASAAAATQPQQQQQQQQDNSSPGSALAQLRHMTTASTSISPASQTGSAKANSSSTQPHATQHQQQQGVSLMSPLSRAGSSAGHNSAAGQPIYSSSLSAVSTATMPSSHYYTSSMAQQPVGDQLFQQMLMQQSALGLSGYGNLAAAAAVVASSGSSVVNQSVNKS